MDLKNTLAKAEIFRMEQCINRALVTPSQGAGYVASHNVYHTPGGLELQHLMTSLGHKEPWETGGSLNITMSYQYRDPMLKIRRSHDRLIFNMGLPIHGKTVFILRRGPGCDFKNLVY